MITIFLAMTQTMKFKDKNHKIVQANGLLEVVSYITLKKSNRITRKALTPF